MPCVVHGGEAMVGQYRWSNTGPIQVVQYCRDYKWPSEYVNPGQSAPQVVLFSQIQAT